MRDDNELGLHLDSLALVEILLKITEVSKRWDYFSYTVQRCSCSPIKGGYHFNGIAVGKTQARHHIHFTSRPPFCKLVALGTRHLF